MSLIFMFDDMRDGYHVKRTYEWLLRKAARLELCNPCNSCNRASDKFVLLEIAWLIESKTPDLEKRVRAIKLILSRVCGSPPDHEGSSSSAGHGS